MLVSAATGGWGGAVVGGGSAVVATTAAASATVPTPSSLPLMDDKWERLLSYDWPISANNAPLLHSAQAFGENLFGAVVAVSFVQAVVFVVQYRTNPSGQLVVPPGRTVGIEYPDSDDDYEGEGEYFDVDEDVDADVAEVVPEGRRRQLRLLTAPARDDAEATTKKVADEDEDDFLLRRTAIAARKRRRKRRQRREEEASLEENKGGDERDDDKKKIRSSSSQRRKKNLYQRLVHRTNRWLFLLLPWISRKLGFVLERNAHLFHFAFIMTLAQFFETPNRVFTKLAAFVGGKRGAGESEEDGNDLYEYEYYDLSTMVRSGANNASAYYAITPSLLLQQQSSSSDEIKRVAVIGDSLAVGLGCVDKWDPDRNNSLPYQRIENFPYYNAAENNSTGTIKSTSMAYILNATTAMNVTTTAMTTGQGEEDNNDYGYYYGNDSGPVFPRVLAQTIARSLDRPVYWRSSGVDGGDTAQIERYCLGMIEEECRAGRVPDVVVILTSGINDLKRFASNPFRNPNPRQFRMRLAHLVSEIRRLAGPQCTVVLPSIATQMLNKNSPLNVFPLVLFLDSIIGFWDSQKKLAADRFGPNNNVLYLGLSPSEIFDWYDARERDGDKSSSLLASDGVHPNAYCYEYYARSIGNKLVTALTEMSTPAASSSNESE